MELNRENIKQVIEVISSKNIYKKKILRPSFNLKNTKKT